MATWAPAEKKLLKVCRETLDSIICKWTADIEADPEVVIDKDSEYRAKDAVMVDRAISEMWARLLNRKDDVFGEVKNIERMEREAHHLAVNAYFRIYRSRKRGRPKSDPSEVAKMIEMKRAGKSYRQIATVFGLNSDLVRKRLNTAASQKRKQ